MIVGTEWLIDARGCRADRLADLPAMRRVCEEVVAGLGLKVVGMPVWHQFPDPGGVTGLYLLSESHLTCHTFPEHGLATLNLYCCRAREPWPWEERLSNSLDAECVVVRRLTRGTCAADSPPEGASGAGAIREAPDEGSDSHGRRGFAKSPAPAARRESCLSNGPRTTDHGHAAPLPAKEGGA